MKEIEYILKHKENPVMEFAIDNDTYRLLRIGKVFDEERLPFGLKDKGNMVQYAIQLDAWLQCRGLSGSRKDLQEIKKLFNNQGPRELMIKSYGLNLTDHYWMHKTNENLSWDKLNCFDNAFDKITDTSRANPVIDKSVDNKSPNFCVDGSIEKRWIIENGERYLLKGSRFSNMQEPFNEVIASKIMKEYGINHVTYELGRANDTIPFSRCKCMVNRDTEYINAQTVIDSEDCGRKDPLGHYIAICEKNGIANAKQKIDAMLSMDFLIGNEDRHKGNFGIIRDANNLRWIDIAPLFDHGNSLFFDKNNDNYESFGIDSLGKAFGDSNRLNINGIDYPEWYSGVDSGKITDIVHGCLKCNERLPEERINKIVDITNKRIKIFEKEIAKKPAICYHKA